MRVKNWGIILSLGLAILPEVARGVNHLTNHHQRLPMSYKQLCQLNVDQTLPHEALPQNVPASYDWQAHPVIQAGNITPKGFSAITGWGQIFWADSVKSSSDLVQVRTFKMLVCTTSGNSYKWTLLQQGDIEGRQFRADFLNNENKAPLIFKQKSGITTVEFAVGTVFHFWFKDGRASLPFGQIRGIVTVIQARTVPSEPGSERGGAGSYLIGLGGDYWLNLTAPWDQYKTNTGIAIGRLKFIGPNWKWYGMSAASEKDLLGLYQRGYISD